MAIEFTVDHDHTYASSIGFEQLIGWITASVGTLPGDFRVREVGAGLARTINLPPRKGYLHSDGHVYRDQTLGEPFRLVANDPAFNLQHLTYRVDFEFTTLAGDPVAVPPAFFSAPSSDTILQLTKVMSDPYQPVMEVRSKVYTEDILDAGGFGQDVVFTGSASDFWELAGEVPSANLPSYVDDILEFDNYAAFPVAEEAETGKIYVAKDSNASYRWSGSQYVHAGNPTSFPNNSGFATVVNRASVIDLRDFLTEPVDAYGMAEFDLPAVVAAMEAGGGECYIPPGRWFASDFNVPVDEANLPAYANSSDEFRWQYVFRGAGAQSRIFLPAGMSVGDALLVGNAEGDAASFAGVPKVVFEDFSVSGGVPGGVRPSSPDGVLFRGLNRSVSARNVNLSVMRGGWILRGYTDGVNIRQVYALLMTEGGWIVDAETHGDGHVYEGFSCDNLTPCGAIKISGCGGGVIRNCLNGFYRITDSVMSISDMHCETRHLPDGAPIFAVSGSIVNFASGWYQTKKDGRGAIEVNDVGQPSTVTIGSQTTWFRRLGGPGDAIGLAANPALDIISLHARSVIRIEQPVTYCYTHPDGKSSNYFIPYLAPHVTASGVAAVQTLLDEPKVQAQLGSGLEIRRRDNAWAVVTPTNNVGTITPTNAVDATAQAVTDASWETNLASGTYYYRVYTVDASGQWSAATAELTAAMSGGNNSVRIDVSPQVAPTCVRILRGTSAGTYTHWVQLPIVRTAVPLWDQGTHIAGYEWRTTGVPSWSATSGQLPAMVHGSGSRIAWGSAAPTFGDYLAGDIVLNSAATSDASVVGWQCVTAGNPGTWAVIPSETSTSTLTRKTLTRPKIDVICGTNGAAAIELVNTPGSVNYLSMIPSADLGPLLMVANGDSTNITGYLVPKGAGGWGVFASTGNPARWIANGPDSSHSWLIESKGAAGDILFKRADGVARSAVDVSSEQALSNKDLTSGTNVFPTFNQSTSGNAATATKLASAVNISGVAFDGSASITAGLDMPVTQLRVAANRAVTSAGSNSAIYQRVMGHGAISKIGLWVKTSSGNISVAVYSNSGVGSAAVPATRLATSGAVACPAAGYAEISLGQTVSVKPGDWFALTADNVTAAFASPLADTPTANDLGRGWQYAQESAHPAPSTAGSLTATIGYDAMLKGVS